MHYTISITNNFKFLLSTRVVSTIIKNSKISNKLWSVKIGSTDASYEFDETYYSHVYKKSGLKLLFSGRWQILVLPFEISIIENSKRLLNHIFLYSCSNIVAEITQTSVLS